MAKSPDAFRTISEVSRILDLQAHVLRFWETKFNQVKPIKRAGGRRYYRPADIALLAGIKQLLHEDGLTIRGVQKVLRERGVGHVSSLAPPALDAQDEIEIAEPPAMTEIERPDAEHAPGEQRAATADVPGVAVEAPTGEWQPNGASAPAAVDDDLPDAALSAVGDAAAPEPATAVEAEAVATDTPPDAVNVPAEAPGGHHAPPMQEVPATAAPGPRATTGAAPRQEPAAVEVQPDPAPAADDEQSPPRLPLDLPENLRPTPAPEGKLHLRAAPAPQDDAQAPLRLDDGARIVEPLARVRRGASVAEPEPSRPSSTPQAEAEPVDGAAAPRPGADTGHAEVPPEILSRLLQPGRRIDAGAARTVHDRLRELHERMSARIGGTDG